MNTVQTDIGDKEVMPLDFILTSYFKVPLSAGWLDVKVK